jgi:DNA-binding MarR family transcriptional regulator
MGEILKRRLKQSNFESSEQEAILNILVSSNHIKGRVDSACSKSGITVSQYNVLRILKGKYPDGYARFDIIGRMIDPAPDVTRLIDRLIKQGLVERFTSDTDRRLSMARITKKGIELLDLIKPQIDDINEIITKSLNSSEISKLSILLEKVYADLF